MNAERALMNEAMAIRLCLKNEHVSDPVVFELLNDIVRALTNFAHRRLEDNGDLSHVAEEVLVAGASDGSVYHGGNLSRPAG